MDDGEEGMRAWTRRLWLAISALCAVVVLEITQPVWTAADSAEPVLRVGLEDFYPPLAYTNEHGEHTGFDRDMAVALCKQMKARCTFFVHSFDIILDMMARGELDVAVSSLAATEERRKYMDFTEAYYSSRAMYIGRPGIEISKEGLRNKVVAAQQSTQQLSYLREHWVDIAEIRTGSFAEVLKMLRSNQVDVILADSVVCVPFLKSEAGQGFDILGKPLEIDPVWSRARIGVRKGQKQLVQDLNEALLALRVNGEHDRIARSYFPFNIY